jgi:hypothetical protein
VVVVDQTSKRRAVQTVALPLVQKPGHLTTAHAVQPAAVDSDAQRAFRGKEAPRKGHGPLGLDKRFLDVGFGRMQSKVVMIRSVEHLEGINSQVCKLEPQN